MTSSIKGRREEIKLLVVSQWNMFWMKIDLHEFNLFSVLEIARGTSNRRWRSKQNKFRSSLSWTRRPKITSHLVLGAEVASGDTVASRPPVHLQGRHLAQPVIFIINQSPWRLDTETELAIWVVRMGDNVCIVSPQPHGNRLEDVTGFSVKWRGLNGYVLRKLLISLKRYVFSRIDQKENHILICGMLVLNNLRSCCSMMCYDLVASELSILRYAVTKSPKSPLHTFLTPNSSLPVTFPRVSTFKSQDISAAATEMWFLGLFFCCFQNLSSVTFVILHPRERDALIWYLYPFYL